MKKERFEAINDAVLAIIITIMVLEIKLPELSLDNILSIFQYILIYAVSFVSIAILWINHHHIFINVEEVEIKIVWINFGLLFFTSLIPMATEHLSMNIHEKANHIFFGVIFSIVILFYTLIQHLVFKVYHAEIKQKINIRNWIAVIFFLLSIPLSFISLYLSIAIFLLVPLMYFLISNKVKK